jgi:hypothetical protein
MRATIDHSILHILPPPRGGDPAYPVFANGHMASSEGQDTHDRQGRQDMQDKSLLFCPVLRVKQI